MPPLLKTYFNPSHRSFLQTLFCATFLASLTIAAFPCPVRHEASGAARNENGDGEEETGAGYSGGYDRMRSSRTHGSGSRSDRINTTNPVEQPVPSSASTNTRTLNPTRHPGNTAGRSRGDPLQGESAIVTIMNQRSKGSRRFMEED